MSPVTTRTGPTAQTLSDVHAGLHAVRVAEVVRPRSAAELSSAVRAAAAGGRAVSIAGGRHAMGGQPFGAGTLHLDMRGLDRVLALDLERGIVDVEAGILWPALVEELHARQTGQPVWGIRQKQTGADRLSLGGALAANVHGRGLALAPIVGDVESFRLVDAEGELHECSRTENPLLFRLAIGGYGLFGPIHSVRLRLARRTKLARTVRLITADELMPAFEERIAEGCVYGDFQFAIDPESDDFLHRGVFSCYRPVDPATPVPPDQKKISAAGWIELLRLAHVQKSEGFRRYAEHYLATDGQVYWSDTHQASTYLDDYHGELDRHLGGRQRGTEVIGEVYVPRPELAAFLRDARAELRRTRVDVIYGTIRLIRRDEESFLPWAKDDYACMVLNLHTEHTPAGIECSARAFRGLIDLALRRRGSFYLTYHRFATRAQVEAAYPGFRAFLDAKLRFDPDERFTSDWYRHYRDLFAMRGAA